MEAEEIGKRENYAELFDVQSIFKRIYSTHLFSNFFYCLSNSVDPNAKESKPIGLDVPTGCCTHCDSFKSKNIVFEGTIPCESNKV